MSPKSSHYGVRNQLQYEQVLCHPPLALVYKIIPASDENHRTYFFAALDVTLNNLSGFPRREHAQVRCNPTYYRLQLYGHDHPSTCTLG